MDCQKFSIPFVCGILSLALSSLSAFAVDTTPVLGKWKVVTQMGANPSESMMEFSAEGDTLKGVGSGKNGSINLDEVTFDGKTLSWKLTIQGNVIQVNVDVEGDGFKGAAITPLGNLPVTGTRYNEAEADANHERLRAMIGDWEVFTEFNGNTVETKLRVYMTEDDDIGGMLIMLGSRTTIHEFELDGDQLHWRVGLPLIATKPAEASATLSESGNYFEGVVKSAAGDIPIRAQMVDTKKLVVAPYDDPTLLLGTWDVSTIIGEVEEHHSRITFADTPEKLTAHIESEGATYEANAVDFHIVNEKTGMAAARVHVTIPELGPDELIFEMIISGENFEGEELYSKGNIVISGVRAK